MSIFIGSVLVVTYPLSKDIKLLLTSLSLYSLRFFCVSTASYTAVLRYIKFLVALEFTIADTFSLFSTTFIQS
jgi:hypothetical protein